MSISFHPSRRMQSEEGVDLPFRTAFYFTTLDAIATSLRRSRWMQSEEESGNGSYRISASRVAIAIYLPLSFVKRRVQSEEGVELRALPYFTTWVTIAIYLSLSHWMRSEETNFGSYRFLPDGLQLVRYLSRSWCNPRKAPSYVSHRILPHGLRSRHTSPLLVGCKRRSRATYVPNSTYRTLSHGLRLITIYLSPRRASDTTG